MTDEELMQDVPAEVIELNGHLLLQLTMNSGDVFGFYVGKPGEDGVTNIRGPVEYGTKFIVPERNLSWVDAYLLATELGLEPVSFGEYAADIRCGPDWGNAYAIMEKKKEAIRETMPPRYELDRKTNRPKRVQPSVKVQRPAWMEAVKDASELHTDELIIDARHVDDVIETDGVYIPVGELGLAGKLVVVRYGFDEAGKPSVSFEQDGDRKRVSVNKEFAREIDPTHLLGDTDRFPEDYSARCTGHYSIGQDRRVDLETTVNSGVTAQFKPGFVGVMGTGGAYRSKVAPGPNMAHCGQRNIAFRLPSK